MDKTGLTGKYDFTLKFDPRSFGANVVVGPQMQSDRTTASDPGSGLPDIFRAVERQLGLKLVRAKGFPLDTIVIDQMEKVPTEN